MIIKGCKSHNNTYIASFAVRPSSGFPLIMSKSSPVPFSYKSSRRGLNFIFISCKKSDSQSSIFSGRELAGFLPGFSRIYHQDTCFPSGIQGRLLEICKMLPGRRNSFLPETSLGQKNIVCSITCKQ